MCIGVPMTVLACDGDVAIAEGCGERRVVSTALVGNVAPGAAILVHLNDAIRVLDPCELEPLTLAVMALAAARRGENVDAMFPDLAEREPELPAHLRTKETV